MSAQRQCVLALYKRIMRLGRTWTSTTGQVEDTKNERTYIQEEAQRLFRQNMSLADPVEISAAIKEAESRVALAIHYKNPWPRPTHIPQHMLPLTQRRSKKSDRLLHQSKPAYIRSYDIGELKKP